MKARRLAILGGFAMVLVGALEATGQTNPTGTISGRVVDAQQLPLPGATVTATSPSLQGARTATRRPEGHASV